MDPLHLLDRSRRLIEALTPFPTLDALRASPAGRERLAEAQELLDTIRGHEAPVSAPAPTGTRLRMVHWNIEHGNRFDEIRRALTEHPQLAGAEIVSLNEVDLGMARSGNRDVAFELARALGCHAVWAPFFLELGVGRHDDSSFAAGRVNRESLFGLALLSRLPLGRAWLVPLPSPEAFHFRRERMLGRHCALAVEVHHPRGAFVAVTTHLDVHRRTEHRRQQMATIVDSLQGERRPVVLAGDFNTHTFDRGSAWDSAVGLAVLALTPGPLLRARLRKPNRPARRPWEPLFRELERGGFEWESLNDSTPTLRLRFSRLGEVDDMPAGVRHATLAGLAHIERRAHLRLDWIAARGMSQGSGHTVSGLDEGPQQASDHAPIVAEVELPTSAA